MHVRAHRGHCLFWPRKSQSTKMGRRLVKCTKNGIIADGRCLYFFRCSYWCFTTVYLVVPGWRWCACWARWVWEGPAGLQTIVGPETELEQMVWGDTLPLAVGCWLAASAQQRTLPARPLRGCCLLPSLLEDHGVRRS